MIIEYTLDLSDAPPRELRLSGTLEPPDHATGTHAGIVDLAAWDCDTGEDVDLDVLPQSERDAMEQALMDADPLTEANGRRPSRRAA